MKRPAGFDSGAPARPAEPPAAPERRRAPRLVPAVLRRDRSAVGGPAGGERGDADPSAAGRVLRELRDSVLPAHIEAEPPPPRASAPPRDREAERDARRAARRRRRAERREVRRFTRRSRHRRVVLTVAAGTVLTMAGLVAVCVYSPLLALREITIEGASRIDPADLHDAVDGQLGTPLALLDMDRMTEELGDFPLIRSFVTETVPPGTLVVHVVERQPIGTLPTPGGFALVDPAGIVIERSAERIPGVPLIDVGAEGADDAGFDAAVEVLLALPDPVLAGLDTITATTRDDVRLRIAETGGTIVWGSADRSEYKARVLQALLANVPEASEFNVSAPGQATYTP